MNEIDHAIEVVGLNRAFRGRVALDAITLHIPKGDVFGLVGLNGAGKTTLIRHLIGSLKPQSGTVRVLGSDPVRTPETTLRRVGYMTEEDSLPKWIRVGELIDFYRAIYPTWDDQYANQLCDMFSLSRQTHLKSLSKGGRARAGLLVAIAHRPELLILDEPSSGLDPIARRDILEAVIRTVNEDGRTVLFSSHLLDEVDRVCDRVALLHEGRLKSVIRLGDLPDQYVEIVGVVDSSWQRPAETNEQFGWYGEANEWSVVCREGSPPNLGEGFRVIEQRPVSLTRWFAASTQTTLLNSPNHQEELAGHA
ncbi:ABC transporter ATP-binding protein [Neorhodopirellula pilleata]|uniref:ABC transporter ATP-binding protein YtrB n=1 Tax=Neorhodopirellula pilleata TaxID=2714738 RepID=A0A5C6AAU0_9BACT|nr:ABC transporter ATP-binding protein [Neorhodopirellula pilleata]TWT95443.1 ABC transporter ATP-binding protein YtrB [Neorhodopirellula pilleata]